MLLIHNTLYGLQSFEPRTGIFSDCSSLLYAFQKCLNVVLIEVLYILHTSYVFHFHIHYCLMLMRMAFYSKSFLNGYYLQIGTLFISIYWVSILLSHWILLQIYGLWFSSYFHLIYMNASQSNIVETVCMLSCSQP